MLLIKFLKKHTGGGRLTRNIDVHRAGEGIFTFSKLLI